MDTIGTNNFLTAMTYYTDTENSDVDKKPEILFLSPNSITKVRVYLWLEGQDVDNYDFASLGKKISVAFGFTKQRYFDEDVQYNSTNTAVLPDDVIKNEANRSTANAANNAANNAG